MLKFIQFVGAWILLIIVYNLFGWWGIIIGIVGSCFVGALFLQDDY